MPDPITPDVLLQTSSDDGAELAEIAVYHERVVNDHGDALLEAAKERLRGRLAEGHHLANVTCTTLAHGAIINPAGAVLARLDHDNQVAVRVTAGQVPS